MKIISNFFDTATLELIQECYLQNFDKGDWIHGYSFYEKKGVKHNLEIMVLKTDQLKESIVKYLLDAKIIKHKPKDFVCMLHYAGSGCSIDWHTDAPSNDDTTGNSNTCGITIFMNKTWQNNWGGQFMHKNKFDDMEGILNNGVEPHGVAPVSYGADPRLTFQIFLDKDSLND
jgi:hypothetical protein